MAAANPGSLIIGGNVPPKPPPPPPSTPPEPEARFKIFGVMAKLDGNKRYKYLPILVFQFILAILYFVFADYDGEKDVDLRGPKSASFMDVHVMIFVGFGFLMTFLKRYSFTALGLNLLLAAVAIQWAIFCNKFWSMTAKNDWTLRINKETLVDGDISAAQVLITFGAVLGYASPTQLLYITIIEIFIGSINSYLVWEVFLVKDIGGSICIHAFGAYFGLGISAGIRAMTHAKTQPNDLVEGKNGSTYASDITAMIGTLFLWVYWPSFNAGLAITDAEYQRSFINTYLSLASCTVVTFVLSSLLNHKPGRFEMVHVQNSTLAGGVAVGTIANMFIGPGGAMLVGIGAAIISVSGYLYLTPKLNSLGLRDTCGVHNLHGLPAVFSGLLGVLFAAMASPELYGDELEGAFPGMADPSRHRSAALQAFFQLVSILMTVMVAFVSGLVTGLLLNLCPMPYKHRYEDNPIWDMPQDYPGKSEPKGTPPTSHNANTSPATFTPMSASNI